jgi:DNA-binding transcriptional LysR family regulator
MRFDVSDLRIFKAVVESSSMTKAAARVHLTVASVSERIKQMEDEVGVPLLSRNRSGVAPTEAGRVLLHHALKVLKQVDAMNESLVNFASHLRSSVRLYTTAYGVAELLPLAVPSFLKGNRNADLIVEEQLSEDIVFAVSTGAADIGIVGDFVDTGQLHTISLLQDRLVAIVGEQSSIGLGEKARFSDLLTYDFVGLGQGSRLQELLDFYARECGATMRHRVRVRNLTAMCDLAADDVGIAIVPKRAAQRLAKDKTRMIELMDDWAAYNTNAIVRSRADLGTSASALLDCLSSCATL